MIARTRTVLLLSLVAAAVVLAACGGGGGGKTASAPPNGQAPLDPAQPGPYGVRLTKMTFERSSTIDGSPRTLDTWIWYPAAPAAGDASPDAAIEPAEGRFPIVVFSHGSGGQPNFYKFFTEHLASWGFVVVAPPHPGNTSADCFPCAGASIVTSARERPGDIDFIMERMAALHDDTAQPLGRIIDPTRAAIAGHSFGGWTAIFAAPGARFAAVVAMAPGLPESLIERAASITAPVMLLGGGKDELVPARSVARLDAALPAATTAYVSFPEGHHLTFSDRCLGCSDAPTAQRGHDLVNRYATAFLETYVMKDDRYAHYLAEDVAPDALIVHDAAAGR